MSERVVLIKQGSLEVEQDINSQDVFITTHYRSTDRDILNILSDIRKKEVDYIDRGLLRILEELFLEEEEEEEEDKTLSCNMCGGDMEHHIKNDTHIYTCEDCPFIGMEFYETEDIKNLERFLSEEKKHENI